MKSFLTHTALLLRSAENGASYFKELGYCINETEIFEGTNTKEIYVGDHSKESSLILLMEPSGDGPYSKALHKRGESLHHLGLDVENLNQYCKELGKVGWLLHTHSLESIPKLKTAYLVRPNMPVMLEVHERVQIERHPSLLSKIGFPELPALAPMLAAISCVNAEIITSSKIDEVEFFTSKHSFKISDIMSFPSRGST